MSQIQNEWRDQPERETWSVSAEGTVQVRDLAIPLSPLVSPEFNAFYRRQLAAESHLDVPAPDASKAVWDEFSRVQNQENVERLTRAKELYAVDVEETTIAGVSAAIVTPRGGVRQKNRDRVLLNLRGGGFMANKGLYFGQLESVPVAALGGFKVITLDYRQAPFHCFPAASEDVEAVYRVLLKDYQPEAIGIYGCSAGGLLTAQSVARMAVRGLPRPGAAGVLSMSLSPPARASLQWHAAGDAAVWAKAIAGPPPKDMEGWERLPPYMGQARTSDPLAWPGASDAVLARFPPTLFLVGTREEFMSTAILDHARMLRLGAEASLYLMEGAPHAAHVVAVDTPEAREANGAIARFFDHHLAGH